MQLVDAKKYEKQIKYLYKTAFPRNERAPFFFLCRKTKNQDNSFYAISDNEEFVGLVYTIKNERMVYVFFLAIEEEKRSKGYGSKTLALIKEMYTECVVTLAIEDTADEGADNHIQRIKRLEFYKRNGFEQLNIRVNEAGVVYELLGTKTGVTQTDFLALMKNYLGAILFKIIYSSTKME